MIQTPPHSPEEPSIPRRLSDGKTGSPPPPATKLDEDDTDSTTTADSDLDQALDNTRRNSGSLPPPPSAFSVQPGTRAPYNPFARTLETAEAAFGLQKREAAPVGGVSLDGQTQPRPGAGKPALDVDAFKNILMTGSAAPSPPNSQPSQKPQDSSSGTDTSSLSRQSIFDQMHEAHLESPRTSFDDHEHRSDDDEDSDNEHSSLMGPVASRPIEEGPPRPPKHPHGKAFPQTVSFADFDESIPPAFPLGVPRTPAVNPQLQGIMRPSTPRSASDLNKPLPPPPAAPHTQIQQNEVPPSQQQTPSVAVAEKQPQAKKAPPPPPASRRPGASNTSHERARSASNLSQDSAQQLEPDATPRATDQSLKPVPPPPPARRSQPVSDSSSPAVETPPRTSSPNQPALEPKAMPPPPPRRFPSKSKSGTSVTRTPSNASRTSQTPSDLFPAASTSGQAPPAPPPRRGGASVRNSMDGPPNSLSTRRSNGNDYRRSSGQSFESDRSVSISSLQQVAEPGESEEAVSSTTTGRPERDILADMSAFQAEIDALRAQGGRGG